MSKNIVFVTSVFDEVKEGPAIYARYLYDHFKESGDIVFHVVTLGESPDAERIHRVRAESSSVKTYESLQKRAIELAGSLGPDTVIHGNAAHTMWLFCDSPWPLLVQVNDYDPATVYRNTLWYLKQGLFRQYLVMNWRRYNERRVVRCADLVICNSAFTRSIVEDAYGSGNVNAKTVYKAVDTARFKRPQNWCSDSLTGKNAHKRLVFIGTNWIRKGLMDLVAAVELCIQQGAQLKLEVIGPTLDALSDELRAKIESPRLRGSIRVLGPVGREKIPLILWNSDLAVLPSHHEALGVSIIEALAAGIPVVATDVGGIPEILDGQDCGFLVHPGDPIQLAMAILKAFESKARLASFSANAERRASFFSKDAMLEQIEKIYLAY